MLLSTNVLGALLALASAGLWGGGDFSGGLAARRLNSLQVLVLASFSGCVVMLGCLWLTGEGLMSTRGMLWAIGAGASGALGSASLYRALAAGRAASVAPAAAVIGAALPVVFGIVRQGWPGQMRLLGFGVALVGIWLVSRSTGGDDQPRSAEVVGLTLLSGLGFGGFFIQLSLTDAGAVYMPVLLVRSTALVISVALVGLFVRGGRATALRANRGSLLVGLLAGVADAICNISYMLAKQGTRLDVATVLGSLYPAATVLLTCVVLKECVIKWQWLGVGLCLAAIVLITL
jgi:uncharacterized membrane protein